MLRSLSRCLNWVFQSSPVMQFDTRPSSLPHTVLRVISYDYCTGIVNVPLSVVFRMSGDSCWLGAPRSQKKLRILLKTGYQTGRGLKYCDFQFLWVKGLEFSHSILTYAGTAFNKLDFHFFSPRFPVSLKTLRITLRDIKGCLIV